MAQTLRKAAVAGMFYPSDPGELRREVESYLVPGASREPALALIAPHAGYVYSGGVAGETYSAVDLPSSFFILCPNHTGAGPSLSVWEAGEWETPLGRAEVHEGLAGRLLEACPAAEADREAHLREHSLEVQLPFLQVLRGEGFRFVPVTVGSHDRAELRELGEAIATVVKEAGEEVLVVVSSDMTHYEPEEEAAGKDREAIGAVEALDPDALLEVCRRRRVTMCGLGPAVAALDAARELGATRGRLVRYTTSAEASGDRSSVVGYAGVVIS
jgi:AmmeMemoRadiSam system protein B